MTEESSTFARLLAPSHPHLATSVTPLAVDIETQQPTASSALC